MSKNSLLTASAALILLALVLVVSGLHWAHAWMWTAGMAVLAVAMAAALASGLKGR